jgi:hypothetical protein
MTDNLRDRLAAVLGKWVANWLALKMADAVIDVMREEKAVKNVALAPPLINTYASPEAAVEDFNGAPPCVQRDLRLVHRYVTEWTDDE